MKILINYADKQYEPARKWNTLTGRYIARFDKVYEYTPNDIDQSFAKLHHDILSQKRGNGLWLWKPYFVNKALSDCSDGDIIFYCDSGSFFIGRGIIANLSEKQPLFVCDIPLLESCFTKPVCFEKMGLTEEKYKASNQIIATYFCFLVTPATRKFMKEWLSLCKKHGISPHRDISQRGKQPETYKSPFYAYKIPIHPNDKYKPIIFLHKSPRLNLQWFIRYIYHKIKP